MTIDNNVSERALRHQAIGRKNWLFLGSKNAGPRAAVLYTILAGAKRHRLEPWTYVRELLMRLHADDARLEEMLPDRWAAEHPEAVLTHHLEESRQKASQQRDRRRRMLHQFDDQLRQLERTQSVNQFNVRQSVAFDLLTSKQIRAAFDFNQESDARRNRYGRTLFGTSTLLARRLAQAGSRFINVSYDNMGKRFGVSQSAWDTHGRNFNMLKRSLLPDFDRVYSALIEDLDESGLLDETLVIVMGEMGRTPEINKDAGRDH